METTYGAGTDPTPFIALAFGLGSLGLAGFFAWTALERRKLRALLAALRQSN